MRYLNYFDCPSECVLFCYAHRFVSNINNTSIHGIGIIEVIPMTNRRIAIRIRTYVYSLQCFRKLARSKNVRMKSHNAETKQRPPFVLQQITISPLHLHFDGWCIRNDMAWRLRRNCKRDTTDECVAVRKMLIGWHEHILPELDDIKGTSDWSVRMVFVQINILLMCVECPTYPFWMIDCDRIIKDSDLPFTVCTKWSVKRGNELRVLQQNKQYAMI